MDHLEACGVTILGLVCFLVIFIPSIERKLSQNRAGLKHCFEGNKTLAVLD